MSGNKTQRRKGYRGGPPPVRQYREAWPVAKGGAGNHFPWWVTPAQAKNHLSFLDVEMKFPALARMMAADARYFPDRYTFKKVRSLGSPHWEAAS